MSQAFLIAVPVYVFCLLLGFLLFLRPAQALEIQRRFYFSINWRVEPVSVERELRMTRLMGIFMIVMVVTSFVLVCYQL
jgi:hypothetical protein